MAVDVIYWPTADPTATEGARNTVLDAYRAVREALRRRITEDWIGGPPQTLSSSCF